MEIDDLQKANRSLKQQIQARLRRFEHLRNQIQSKYSSRHVKQHWQIQPYIQILKIYNMATKEWGKINTMMEEISKGLINNQVKRNTSDQYRKVVKLLETKVSELRAQMHVKQVNYIQARENQATQLCLSDDFLLPKNYQFRKLNIQNLHRQKIEKLLKQLPPASPADAKQEIGKQVKAGDLLGSNKQKLNSYQKYILECMISEIVQQERRRKQLQEKYEAYRNILQLVNGDGRSVRNQLLKTKFQ